MNGLLVGISVSHSNAGLFLTSFGILNEKGSEGFGLVSQHNYFWFISPVLVILYVVFRAFGSINY